MKSYRRDRTSSSTRFELVNAGSPINTPGGRTAGRPGTTTSGGGSTTTWCRHRSATASSAPKSTRPSASPTTPHSRWIIGWTEPGFLSPSVPSAGLLFHGMAPFGPLYFHSRASRPKGLTQNGWHSAGVWCVEVLVTVRPFDRAALPWNGSLRSALFPPQSIPPEGPDSERWRYRWSLVSGSPCDRHSLRAGLLFRGMAPCGALYFHSSASRPKGLTQNDSVTAGVGDWKSL